MQVIDRPHTLLNLNPLVVVFDDVFDEALANHIIAKGDGNFRRGAVVDPAGGAKQSDKRTSENARIDQWSDPKLTELITDISSLVRLPPENSEPCKLLRYQGEQKFELHSDGFYQSAGGRQFLADGGQRLFTTLCYLNDVEAGGETAFPYLKIKIKPRLGRVLIFGNTRLGTNQPHPHAHHAGRTVEAGVKYALSTWWRQLAYHVQREYPEEQGETRSV